MAKSDVCAGRHVHQVSIMTRNVDLERRQQRKTFLILIAASFVAFATWFVIISALFELFGSERRYASNFGVSISKCQEIFQIFGILENGQCSRRVPRELKTEMQLAIEVMVMKIERQPRTPKPPPSASSSGCIGDSQSHCRSFSMRPKPEKRL
jgi:hypothetical protein